MSNLLGIALIRLENCEYNWVKPSIDELCLNVICVDLYQVIEFGLKHLILARGEECPRTYDIGMLLSLVSNYYTNSWYEALKFHRNTITSWYTKSE